MDHYFNVNILKRGLTMPQDRLCRSCGKIGHVRKSCPENDSKLKRGKGKRSVNTKEITEQPDSNDSKCLTCGKPGHSISQCPEFLRSSTPNDKAVAGRFDSQRTTKEIGRRNDDFVGNQVGTVTPRKKGDYLAKQENDAFLNMMSEMSCTDSHESSNVTSPVRPSQNSYQGRNNSGARESSHRGGARKRPEMNGTNRNEPQNMHGFHRNKGWSINIE